MICPQSVNSSRARSNNKQHICIQPHICTIYTDTLSVVIDRIYRKISETIYPEKVIQSSISAEPAAFTYPQRRWTSSSRSHPVFNLADCSQFYSGILNESSNILELIPENFESNPTAEILKFNIQLLKTLLERESISTH